MNDLLIEAIRIIEDCEVDFGCECPYCDRDFGEDSLQHSDDCKIKKFLDKANAWRCEGSDDTLVLDIVDSCFHMFASEYRQEAREEAMNMLERR